MKKKFLSFVLATAMVLGSVMTASAATGTAEDTTGQTVTGEGNVEYVDTKVYQVTLPTTATLNLTVDPQGLTGMTGETATLEELDEYAGKVFMQSKPVISNVGSVPTKVTAELTLTGNATAVSTVEAVTVSGNDPANNIILYAVPSAEDVLGEEENYVASTKGIVMTTSGVSVDFILPGADYVVVSGGDAGFSYELADENDKGHGTALSFEGLVNKYADWSDYAGASATQNIGMTAKFTFTHTLTDADVADETEGAPFGMKAMSSGIIEVTAGASGGSGSVLTPNEAGHLIINYTGDAPTTVEFVEVAGEASTEVHTIAGNNNFYLDSSEGYLAILKNYLDVLSSYCGTGSYKIKVNGKMYSFTL